MTDDLIYLCIWKLNFLFSKETNTGEIISNKLLIVKIIFFWK